MWHRSFTINAVKLLFEAYRKFNFVTGHSTLYRIAEYIKHVTVTGVFWIDHNCIVSSWIAAYRKMNPAIPIRQMMWSFCSSVIFLCLNSGVCVCALWVWGNQLDNWVALASEVSASKAQCTYSGYHAISLMCNPWVMCSHACPTVKKNLSYSYLFPSYPQNKRNKM